MTTGVSPVSNCVPKITQSSDQAIKREAMRMEPRQGVRAWAVLIYTTALALAACSDPSANDASPPGAPTSTVDSGAPADSEWCAVDLVLSHKCRRCHQDPPKNGAPFSLLTYADTQLVDGRGKPRFVRMADAVSSGYMPAQFVALDPPVEALTAEERATLLGWCEAGAPPGADCVTGT